MRKGILAALILTFCSLLSAQQELNNSSVVKLAKAGLPDDVIITTINAAPGAYDTSASGLIAMKQAGVRNRVLAAVVLKSVSASPAPVAPAVSASLNPPPAPALPPAPAPEASSSIIPRGINGIGIFCQDTTGQWQTLPGEVVIFESGGLIKHVATGGLVHEDLNGVIGGMRSRFVVSTPAALILQLPNGRTPNDYELLRLHPSGNNRRFQSIAGGMRHETAGAVRDEVPFASRKIGPSTYQVILNSDLGDGEFGFLETQDSATETAPPASGKIYTFAIVD